MSFFDVEGIGEEVIFSLFAVTATLIFVGYCTMRLVINEWISVACVALELHFWFSGMRGVNRLSILRRWQM